MAIHPIEFRYGTPEMKKSGNQNINFKKCWKLKLPWQKQKPSLN